MHYCVGVLEQSTEAQQQALQDAGDDPTALRRSRGALYAEEVKVRCYHCSLTSAPDETDGCFWSG